MLLRVILEILSVGCLCGSIMAYRWILGDQAYSHGTYEFDMASKEGGETRSYSGKFLDILEKQVDGSWKIAIDCQNYNMPGK
jgi:ketosteroid isomerase-like protein